MYLKLFSFFSSSASQRLSVRCLFAGVSKADAKQ